MAVISKSTYISFDNEQFFTIVLLPEKDGRFPTVIHRNPYVQHLAECADEDIVQDCLRIFCPWVDRGYAFVYQHCRGQGKSTGAFVPYVQEREDGLALREWIRTQPFYNGELFLLGSSYSSSLAFSTAPFEEDVKGAVLEVQDSKRYRLWYRNGQMRKGHANWHFDLYKPKNGLHKTHSMASFAELPLKGLSERVLGEEAIDFEQMLDASRPTDPFWDTRFGGVEARNATDHANIPLLLSTGYNDFYVGGIFAMWNRMDEQTKRQSALLVSPYNHSDGANSLVFPNGKRYEQFGSYQIDWCDHVRTGKPLPFQKGVITYYRAFDNRWDTDFYATPTQSKTVSLGTTDVSFRYDPSNPPSFQPEGVFQHDFSARSDVITLYTEPFEQDTAVRGQMRIDLTVSSDRPDTSFYVNISIQKPQGDYTLRHDITSLCYQHGEYLPNTPVTLDFRFDEYAFLIGRGERLRVDIASTDNNTYVSHTNQPGPYATQTQTAIATNTVYLDRSHLILPIEYC